MLADGALHDRVRARMWHVQARLLLTACLGAAVLLLGASGAVSAATIQVTTSVDENGVGPDCSLREAVTAANTNAAFGGCPAGEPNATATDRITFVAATNGNPILLGGTEITISSNLTIAGNGATRTQVSGDDASRVFNVTGGRVTLSDLTVRDGRVTENGGGIRNVGTLAVVRSVVRDNVTNNLGAGISSGGSLTVIDSTVRDNVASGGGNGAGILNTGALRITGSTISGNQGGFGGGLLQGGSATIVNSTFSGNSGSAQGGGMYILGATDIVNSTFSGNIGLIGGGGIHRAAGPVSLRATILDTGSSGANCVGAIASLGSNLSDDGSCAGAFNQTGDANNVALRLGPLSDNGGPTLTHALLDGSPAIDAVRAACTDDGTAGGDQITVDQRGEVRPSGGRCDAGAVERQFASTTPGDDSGRGTGKRKETDEQRPLSQVQQQQQERTNQSNLNQYRTEGNVTAVEPLEDGSGLLITIALGRGETLDIEFRCSLIDCPTLRIGDYITAEGEQGGREERGRFIAEQVKVSRRR